MISCGGGGTLVGPTTADEEATDSTVDGRSDVGLKGGGTMVPVAVAELAPDGKDELGFVEQMIGLIITGVQSGGGTWNTAKSVPSHCRQKLASPLANWPFSHTNSSFWIPNSVVISPTTGDGTKISLGTPGLVENCSTLLYLNSSPSTKA